MASGDSTADPPTDPAHDEFWAGFATFVECDLNGEYLSASELAALSPNEMRGWNAAIEAKDAATYAEYRSNRNSFSDLTEY
jgi:hypothetical protein